MNQTKETLIIYCSECNEKLTIQKKDIPDSLDCSECGRTHFFTNSAPGMKNGLVRLYTYKESITLNSVDGL